MLPTLLVGDFILVNKYTYGIRLPVINIKVADISQPRRGEVMVFRYPENPSLDYIKRVVGLPGDVIESRDGIVYVNDRALDEPYLADGMITGDPEDARHHLREFLARPPRGTDAERWIRHAEAALRELDGKPSPETT